MFKKGRIAAIVVIALILSVTTYAFAAANTVQPSAAGDGAGTITGYSITAVKYTLDSTNSNIIGVSFTASPTGTAPTNNPTFKIQITKDSTVTGATDSLWITCGGTFASGVGTISCPESPSTTINSVVNAGGLRVVAAN
jgi:hypothetical protein